LSAQQHQALHLMAFGNPFDSCSQADASESDSCDFADERDAMAAAATLSSMLRLRASTLDMSASAFATAAAGVRGGGDGSVDGDAAFSAEATLFGAGVEVQEETRVAIAERLVLSEQHYVLALQSLVDSYLLQLRKDAAVSNGKLMSIFGNVRVILARHRYFVDVLSRLVEHDLHNTLGTIFCDTFVWIPLYDIYCKNLPHAKATYNALKGETKVAAVLSRSLRTSGQDLATLMLEPIKRLVEYFTSLTNMLRYTPVSHGDHHALVGVREQLRDVLDRICLYDERDKIFPRGFLDDVVAASIGEATVDADGRGGGGGGGAAAGEYV